MSRVVFKDVVKRINVNVDRHNTERLYYVGGEHIDSSELLVTKRGLIEGSTIGFKFHFGFEPGHILFMSRNPHLRKASMATFSGICSDSTYVVESRDENVLLQKYLLLEMQSDRFWEWAEANKSGGVNYLINYKTLDTYEFELPSLAEQKVLAEKLWAAYEVKQSYLKMIEATEEMVKSQFVEMFGDISLNSKGWPMDSLDSLAEIKIGPFGSLIHQHDYKENGHCLINPSQIINDKIVPDSSVAVSDEKYLELQAYKISKGDIVLGRRGEMGRAGIVKSEGMLCGTGSLIIRPKDINDSFFLHLFVTSQQSKQWLESNSVGTTMMNLNTQIISKMEIPILPTEMKLHFVAIAQQADKSISELRKSIDAIDKVIKSLINENL